MEWLAKSGPWQKFKQKIDIQNGDLGTRRYLRTGFTVTCFFTGISKLEKTQKAQLTLWSIPWRQNGSFKEKGEYGTEDHALKGMMVMG